MSCKAVILAVLLCGLVSRACSIKCLSCTETARPRDCQYVEECGIHEKCSIESYITLSGYIRYNVGCMDGLRCVAAGRKRDFLNATVLNVIQQKNDFGAVPVDQSDQKDVLVCSECCDTELCNIKGCGEEGLPPNSGLLCYACEQEVAPDKCNKIALCSRDSSCHLSTLHNGLDILYKSDCIHTHICHQLGVLDIGAYQLVGRRSVDMISRFQRVAACNKCCTKNLCNLDNCTSLITPSITVATTTQETTTLPPVNGGWGTWSHWNMCSVTCGGGHHFRIRSCNNHPPANAGAPCSGSNTETQICNNQPCTVDGQWTSWTMWSSCSVTCGTGGISSRQRNCDNPRPSATGLLCSGESYEMRQCSGPNGPQVIQSAHNYSMAMGSQVVIKCLEHVIFPLQEVLQVTWTVPQIVGHLLPSNLEYLTDGSLMIHGLRAENCGPYFCTLTTDCGSYDSPDFYVGIY